MCPHCIAAAFAAGAVSIPVIPFAFRQMMSRLPTKANKTARQEAMKKNFDTLYGKPDMSRANPGFIAFQKAMKDDHASH
jgi:hypothetical protein